MTAKQVLVLGAGIVGLSTAVHLRRRGVPVVLADRSAPGSGASFGNGGLIQREAVFPYRFPRDIRDLLRIAGNRAVDVTYDPLALLRLAPTLFRYWRNSAPGSYAEVVKREAALIATCLEEHLDLAEAAGAKALLRPTGWMRTYSSAGDLDAGLVVAKQAKREFGVNFDLLDGTELARAEPDLQVERIGAIHWTDSLSLSDPGALIDAYVALFRQMGGTIVVADAQRLERKGSGWRLPVGDGVVEGSDAVVALGVDSAKITRRYGYAPPLFGKRGYHMHYRMAPGATLNRPLVDHASRFLFVPMSRGVRLTTGVEFAREGSAPNPVQLARAEPIARRLLPLRERVDDAPWTGVRPCMPDMIPVIGPLPGTTGLWCGFGHGHQGMTLGPTTGRLLAELITGEQPFLDTTPYRADRF
jgi:D-amino-acid dehydrogenase